MQIVPSRVVASLNDKKKIVMSDQKPPLVFNNYPLLCLFKLTATSLINSCPIQNQKNAVCFYVLFCLPSFAYTYSLSVVLHDCWLENT